MKPRQDPYTQNSFMSPPLQCVLCLKVLWLFFSSIHALDYMGEDPSTLVDHILNIPSTRPWSSLVCMSPNIPKFDVK